MLLAFGLKIIFVVFVVVVSQLATETVLPQG